MTSLTTNERTAPAPAAHTDARPRIDDLPRTDDLRGGDRLAVTTARPRSSHQAGWPALLRITEAATAASTLAGLLEHGASLLAPLVPSLLGVGVLVAGGEPIALGSGELSQLLTAAESELGDGPATAAVRSGAVTVVELRGGDAAGDGPAWRSQALEHGVACVVARPLADSTIARDVAAAGPAGGLVAFAGVPHAFDGVPVVGLLQLLAAHIAMALSNLGVYQDARNGAATLKATMAEHSVLEQAKGVLMMRERVSAETAWEYLTRTSEATGRPVRELAQDLVSRAATGKLR